MSDYSEVKFYTKSTDCGTDSCLSPYVLLSDLQETADKGASDTGWGRDEIGQYDCCWIVLRCRMKFTRLPSWREEFVISTWSCGSKKLFFDREYEIYDSKCQKIGGASSVWILAEKESHRPVFPSKLVSLPQGLVQSDKLALGELCPKLKIPDRSIFSSDPTIIKYADYSDLDHNHHVNNTRYLAWIYDALHKRGFDVHKFRDININYICEVKSGEKVDIFVSETEDRLQVTGYKNGDTGVFISEIKFGV